MIVVSNNTPKETTPEPSGNNELKCFLMDHFHKELDTYCTYKEWSLKTDDVLLEMALEEIMLDEYLHAKFFREYLINNKMYTVKEDDAYEMKFWKAQEYLFED